MTETMIEANAPGIAEPLRDLWECVYCGRTHTSESGTGGDVVCCGEIGHVQPVNYEEEDANV